MTTLLIFGILYIATLYAIATLYLPILNIAVVYAIAGLVKQVSLTVEKRRERRYNISMETRTVVSGLSVVEAYTALYSGEPVYAVAFQPNSPNKTVYSPIGIGAWTDDNGRLYVEPCFLTTDRDTAFSIGIAEKQKCILKLVCDWNADSRVYVYDDTPSNRGYALANTGGYTSIDGKLLVYSEHFLPHFLAEGSVSFLPVKGYFLPVED